MSAQPPQNTALLDALIARGLAQAQQSNPQALAQAPPLEGIPQLPNPDPNSSPPLFGEPPGEGYLYAKDPEFRQASMVSADPETVRTMLLRAMETLAVNVLLPFGESPPDKNGEAILRIAQAYLLIDPSVDAEGVPVAGRAAAGAAAGIAQAAATQPAPQGSGAHGTVKPGKQVGGEQLPPRVLPGAAGQVLQQMHEHAEDMLGGSRGSRPLPQPRVGA